MFLLEQCPITSFKGFRVVVFRQGRCNLAERTLARTVVHFAPQFALMGVFLASALEMVTEEMLEVYWQRTGAPMPWRDRKEPYLNLFGTCVRVDAQPYVGVDDLWQEDEGLIVTFKRAVDPTHLQRRLEAYAHDQLLSRANTLVDGLVARGARRPKAIYLKNLRRSLGQCSRDGCIYLNPELLLWQDATLEETLAHELVHLKHFNHSPAFWRELTALLPDWLPRTLVHYLAQFR